ncbi:MAG: GntR family transcriptional regulator [Chloroflexota bacterium]|nr:GntR family transcriptional regulator [Chloroflexota bacterium]
MTALTFSLQPGDAVPLYHQLALSLRAQIETGIWKPGDMITSERELMHATGVSRATVRQAISNLIQDGVLERSHGRGTFVARRKMEQEMRSVYSFAEQMARRGLQLEDKLLQRHKVPALDDLAEELAVQPGDWLIHIKRVRYLQGVPLMLDSSYIPYHLCPDLLTDPFQPPLYRMLADNYGLPPTHATDVLEPTLADRAQAHLLQVEVGAPLMFLQRLTFTKGHVPLHVAQNYIPGDRCRFRLNLSSDSTEAELKGGLQATQTNSKLAALAENGE